MGALKAFMSGFAITLTNPVTIFAVILARGLLPSAHMESDLDAYTIVVGIFCGSTLWWVLLSGGIALVRGHFTESRIIIINVISNSPFASACGVGDHQRRDAFDELDQALFFARSDNCR